MGYNILPLVKSIAKMPPVKLPLGKQPNSKCLQCGSRSIRNNKCEHCGTYYA